MRPLTDAVLALVILAAAPVVLTLWMLRLNRRDRRQAAISATAGACCRELGLRGMIAVDVSAAVWTRRARVTLDMRLCNASDIWRVVESLRTRPPRGVTLWIVATGSSILFDRSLFTGPSSRCDGDVGPAEAVARLDSRARRAVTPCPGGAMVWRIWGQGPPLVLLHGASGSWTHWLRNIPPLAERFSVIVPDMPGAE